MADIAEQMEDHGRMRIDTWKQAMQRLPHLSKQVQSLQPLLLAIGQELDELDTSDPLLKQKDSFVEQQRRIRT